MLLGNGVRVSLHDNNEHVCELSVHLRCSPGTFSHT